MYEVGVESEIWVVPERPYYKRPHRRTPWSASAKYEC